MLIFMALFMFATLLIAIILPLESVSTTQLLAYSASPLAYSLMLVGLFIASRPRFIEKHFGMTEMYEIHAMMTVVAVILATLHIAFFWQGFGAIFRSAASIWGYVGYLGMLLGLLSGMFSLSGMFLGRNKTLLRIKEKVLNREVMLWVHRIGALMAIIGTYMQNVSISFLRANTAYMILLAVYTVLILGYYVIYRLLVGLAPRYKVKKIERATPTLWVLEFEPVRGKITEYPAGSYFNIRFSGVKGIGSEGHPFSTSSAVTRRFDNSIEFMIKEAGDWTKALQHVSVGDIATLEGPYGDFFQPEVEELDESVPYVLLGGGIGLTPNLSVLRSEIEKGSQREIHLVWGLSYEEDMFMVDELESYKLVNPNFEYHIIFSNEEVEGYPFGFITNNFLESVGADHYRNGHFFVCGPAPMLNASRKLLDNGNVRDEQRHIDDFGF